jgi:hypothetical protein
MNYAISNSFNAEIGTATKRPAIIRAIGSIERNDLKLSEKTVWD